MISIVFPTTYMKPNQSFKTPAIMDANLPKLYASFFQSFLLMKQLRSCTNQWSCTVGKNFLVMHNIDSLSAYRVLFLMVLNIRGAETAQYVLWKSLFTLGVWRRKTSYHLKGQCHEDFAVLGQFCAKIITLRL